MSKRVQVKNIGEFLALLKNVKSSGKDHWTANCPCSLTHKTPGGHLSISLASDKILLKCFGSDSTEDIVHSLKLELSDLFIASSGAPVVGGRPPKIVATYDYKDEKGELLFQVVRYEPKSFKQRHKNGAGEWVWNLDGVRRVLYHLQDVCLTDEVYLVEGEKDADNLLAWGKIATTSPGGANAWNPDYVTFLKGKRVIIIPDKDVAGYAYAKEVVKSLDGKASNVKVIILPGKAKDISDWLSEGNSVDELANLEEDISVLFSTGKPKYYLQDDAILWVKQVDDKTLCFKAENVHQERTGIHGRLTVRLNDLNLSWSYLNVEKREERSALATACHSTIKGELTKLYTKDDLRTDLDNFCAGLWDFSLSQFVAEDEIGEIQPLRYILKPFVLDEGGTIIYAPPGRGKSQTGMIWAISIDAGLNSFWNTEQVKVLYINLERSGRSLSRRIMLINKVLGLPEHRPLLRINARGRSLQEILPACRRIIKENGVKVIFLDSISRAGVGDLTDNLSGNRVIDALSSLCPTWIALGHTPRASEDHIFGCHDADTEILTIKGWVKFPDWQGQAILTWRNSNGYSNFEYMKPLQFHKYPYSGDMTIINTPSMNACVTPNHRFWIWDAEGKKRWLTTETLTAKFRVPWSHTIKNHNRIKKLLGFPIDDVAELAGIYISEGSSKWGGITLTQAESNHQRIVDCLERMGLGYKIYRCPPKRTKDKQVISQIALSYHKALYRFLRYECGVGAANKKLPGSWKEWQLSAKKQLLDSLMWGDGHWYTRRYGVYVTISRQLADDIQILAMTLGYGSAIKRWAGRDSYSVEIWAGRQWRWLQRAKFENVYYNGDVYCFTMPTGFIVTRRNGRIMVSGNSVMMDAGADICVQLSSEAKGGNLLGIGYQITKQNDTGYMEQQIFALEFEEDGLSNFRKAKQFEFPQINQKHPQDMMTTIIDWIANQDTGDATATEIATEFGYDRANVSRLLSKSGKFLVTRKVKHSVYYGVKQ